MEVNCDRFAFSGMETSSCFTTGSPELAVSEMALAAMNSKEGGRCPLLSACPVPALCSLLYIHYLIQSFQTGRYFYYQPILQMRKLSLRDVQQLPH